MSNPEKSINELKQDSVHGDSIKGGGSTLNQAPMPGATEFNPPSVKTSGDLVQNVLGTTDDHINSAVDISNAPELGYGDDGNILTHDGIE